MATRQFIRHPVSLPIEATPADTLANERAAQAYSIGIGGLAFRSATGVQLGALLHVRIPHVRPEFETEARVVWCRETGSGVELGVEFLTSDDAFRARMVEQVCHIESYRLDVQDTEGRFLSPEEAAMEWIDKYAAAFPGPGSAVAS